VSAWRKNVTEKEMKMLLVLASIPKLRIEKEFFPYMNQQAGCHDFNFD